MEKKIQKTFTYHGLGFPLLLTDVPMVKLRGAWAPDVDYSELEEKMALAVPLKTARLTGDEIRFLRLHLGLSLSALARQLGLTHQAVAKWEKAGAEVTNMSWSTEKDFRLFVLARKEVGDRLFRQAYDSFDRVHSAAHQRLGLPARLISAERSKFLDSCLEYSGG